MSAGSHARTFRRPELHALAWAACALLSLPGVARAQVRAAEAQQAAATHLYALPAAPLKQTLALIAQLSGRRITADDALTGSLQAAPVTGLLSPRQAVQQALAASALTVSEDGSGALEVQLTPPMQVQVVGRRNQAETSFKADRSETATRSGTDLLDVPSSVTVVTSKVLETQQATSVEDALRNVSGVVLRSNAQGLPDFSIRGFSQTSTLVNGVSSPTAAMVDVNGIERVEVLKGPQAILAGGDSLGGAVNIVNKKPQAEVVRDLLLQYGSYGDKTVATDMAGAVGDDKRLSYRVIATWAEANRNDAGYDGRTHKALMPQLRWKDAETDLIVGASIDKQRTPQNRYTFAMSGIQAEPKILLGNKTDGIEVESKRLFYSLEQQLTPWAVLVSRVERSIDTLDTHMYGVQFPVSDTTFGFVPTNDASRYHTFSGDHYVRFNFETGPFTHKLSTGLNHTRQSSDRKYYGDDLQIADVYSGDPYAFPALTHETLIQTDTSDASTQRGLFAQDLIGIGDFNLLLSVRNNKYLQGASQTNYLQYNTTASSPSSSMSKTTPGLGVVYKLQPNISLYASYMEGFLPQFSTATSCGTGPFKPMQTTNKEVGAKFDLLESRLALTASVFELNQKNRLEYDSAKKCYRERDAAQIRGVELELQGQIVKGWNLTMNYTHHQEKDVEDAAAVEAGQPKNAFSLWTTYEFQQEAVKGFGFGLGVTAHSRTLTDYSATAVPVPSYVLMDASLFYSLNRWTATLGIKNLFDRHLYGYSTSPLYVPIEPGRTATFTLRTSFK